MGDPALLNVSRLRRFDKGNHLIVLHLAVHLERHQSLSLDRNEKCEIKQKNVRVALHLASSHLALAFALRNLFDLSSVMDWYLPLTKSMQSSVVSWHLHLLKRTSSKSRQSSQKRHKSCRSD